MKDIPIGLEFRESVARRGRARPRRTFGVCLAWLGLLALSGTSPAQETTETDRPPVVALTRDGRKVVGRLESSSEGDLRFLSTPAETPISTDLINSLTLREGREAPSERPGPASLEGSPFRVLLGDGQVISGRLQTMDAESIRLLPDWTSDPAQSLSIPRTSAVALVQRPGQALVLADAFDRLDPGIWTSQGQSGTAVAADRPENPALVLKAGSNKVTHVLPEPIDSGRLDLSFVWKLVEVEGHRASLELVFLGPNGPETIQVLLGWGEKYPGVIARGGPTLVIQPLVREDGWHRLSIRFRPDRTLLALDGDELASGNGPGGPLQEIRFVTDYTARAAEAKDLEVAVDDLRLIRYVEPTTSLEIDPSQDELRLVHGDQVWGKVLEADENRIELEIDNRSLPFSWAEVSGIHFRRQSEPSPPISGRWLRVEWLSTPGQGDLDVLEAAFRDLGPEAMEVEHPAIGRLSIPRDRIVRIEVGPIARRVILDIHARHLGDQTMPGLDPPHPDADTWSQNFTIEAAEAGPAQLAFLVQDVEGDYDDGRYVDEIRAGNLVTEVVLNDRRVGTLNAFVRSSNKTPERIEVPLPPGILRPGENRLQLRQLGRSDAPEFRDDLGILGITLEWPGS